MTAIPTKKTKKAAITGFPSPILASSLSKEEKKKAIAKRFKEIMEILGLDLSDSSLAKTPERVAKMYVEEVFAGLDPNTFPSICLIDSKTKDMVVARVSFYSFCEHHFVPMEGIAYIAYMPHGKVIGLSKLPRLVRFFARRPQLQERLTAQIADSLATLLNSQDVAVWITARHYCVVARGVEDELGTMTTHHFGGSFVKNSSLREEFFQAMVTVQ